MYYDEKNVEFLQKILEVLKPLELGVKELSMDIFDLYRIVCHKKHKHLLRVIFTSTECR
jgi:hypothetical protein